VASATKRSGWEAIYGVWNWGEPVSEFAQISFHFLHEGWTFQGVKIINCGIGFDLSTGGKTSATQVRLCGCFYGYI
jgi:glucan 1,3-beta-glucosidase